MRNLSKYLGSSCVANVGYMLHDSVGDYCSILDIILLVRSVRWQTSCHGETWVYVTAAADSHVSRESPLIGAACLKTRQMGAPRGLLRELCCRFQRERTCFNR